MSNSYITALDYNNQLFKYQMRTNRGKQVDWGRPFKIISHKSDFDSLETGDNELTLSLQTKPDNETPTTITKQEIIVPKIETVRRITEPKKFAKIEANYIRLTQDLNLPKLMSYELSEVDHVFLQGQANRFRFNGKPIITPEFLSAAFVELEIKAGKDPILRRNKDWMMQFIEREHKQLKTMPNLEQFAEVFYNYWKNRREELKFPMLRLLWRPNPDEYSHLLAFKPREKDKRSLRRTSRLNQDQVIQDLEQQFALAHKITERIKFRESLKMKQLQLNLTNFHNECRTYFSTPTFYSPFQPETRQKDKQKIKHFQHDAELVRQQQIEQLKEQQIELNTHPKTYDQKLSIINFLSTVVFYAQNFSLSHDRIFHNTQKQVNNNKIPMSPPVVKLNVETTDKECLQFTPYKCGDMLFRSLSDDDEESADVVVKTPTTLSELYTMKLKQYSFGVEDEFDFRDLKKNIAQSFKKFQQIYRS